MEEILPNLIDNETLKSEFGHLKGSCYLDQTGAALYARSQVEAISVELSSQLYSNPHSNSLVGRLTEDTVDQVRYRVLQHFNTTLNDYSIIFTSGATEALKIVAETFDFSGKEFMLQSCNNTEDDANTTGEFVYLQDNHTSVLGMRNVDNITLRKVPTRSISQAEAFQTFAQREPGELNHLVPDGLCSESGAQVPNIESVQEVPSSTSKQGNSLFVYPAQCNFSGLKYPLNWIRMVQEGALETHTSKGCKWYCLLDAATHVSTNPLDLSSIQPDFIAISFYKLLGLPTGLGALLVRNISAPVLCKRYYGGGTVQMALASHPKHALRPILHQRFEDGTINFLSIIALRHGLDWLQRAGLDMHCVSQHVYRLARYTHTRLCMLHHANGRAAACIYADTAYDDARTQGGIVNFNMCRDTGEFVGFMEVLALANLHGIHLRTGCFCNPGACQRLLGITDEQYCKNFEAGHVCGDDKDLVAGRPTGSVRVSFGPHSRQQDADRLVSMLTDCFVTKPVVYKEPENWKEKVKLFHKKFYSAVSSPTLNKVKHGFSEYTNGFNNKPKKTITPTLQKDEVCDDTNVLKNSTIKTGRLGVGNKLLISQICLYPVKSCGGFKVDRWALDRRGLRYDRRWMVVTHAGVALTQKQQPRLCLVKPVIQPSKALLILTSKGYPDCSVPLEPAAEEPDSAVWLCQSKVCGDNIQGVDCGDEVALWLSLVLQTEGVRLLRQSDHTKRGMEGNFSSLALSNQAQFLLVNENSVSWLSDRLPPGSDCFKTNIVDRFRSNFVVKGNCPAFEEQNWKEITIGSINFKAEGPCGRCQMICIDQSTGERTKEPLTTLAANCRGRMKFGIYLSRQGADDNVFISVGDQIIDLVV